MEPASEEPTDVHMAPLESTDLSFVEMLQANDAAMDPAPVIHPDPMDVSASPKRHPCPTFHLHPPAAHYPPSHPPYPRCPHGPCCTAATIPLPALC